MTDDGKGVNYPKLKESQIFKEYAEKMAPQLQSVKLDNINENEKKAFFISILYECIQHHYMFTELIGSSYNCMYMTFVSQSLFQILYSLARLHEMHRAIVVTSGQK